MEFKNFRDKLQKNFAALAKNATMMFEVDLNRDELWNLYLDSFPAGKNEVYRERREFDCSCCRQFVKTIGNAVFIKDNKVYTIWGFDTESDTFQPVMDALDAFVKSKAVTDVFVWKNRSVGTNVSREMLANGKIKEWDHFYLELPKELVCNEHGSEGEIRGRYRDTRNVFKRSLDELTMESIDTVLELIAQGSLYRGEEQKAALKEFRKYKDEYEKLPDDEKDNYAWEKSLKAGPGIGRIRNHSIGTLLINLSEDMDLDTAVRKYDQIMAPANYKRPKAIFTKKMLEDAKKTIAELGYMDSLERRFAKLDDITVNNILFSNKDVAKKLAGIDVFAEMAADVAINPKQFSKVEEIGIEQFIANVLPTAREIEAFVETRHVGRMVSLIAPVKEDAKTMFKWNNGFGWAYSGNITDSDIRENVKSAGGSVDGVLRFSIQWNEDGNDNCDLDAHAVEPNNTHIYYSSYKKPRSTDMNGQLDVDIISPNGKVAVENITWPSLTFMKPGSYRFFVKQFSGALKNGFRAEIEMNGEIHSFDYPNSTRSGQIIDVAEVTLDKNGNFTIKELLSGSTKVSSKEVWGVRTNQFVPVSIIMNSPNYWDAQSGIGNKHYFFMLKDCVNPEEPNGFYNEFLKEDLMKHKRVFEALGSKLHVVDADDQLSGIGFSSTQRAELVVKVKGQTERILKIKF